MLTILTISKDDPIGLRNTLSSCADLRKNQLVSQIVIDGSNKMNSHKIKQLCKANNVEYYWQEPTGISDAFNYGIIQAESKWLWFLNSGDKFITKFDSKILFLLLDKINADILIFQIKFGITGSVSKTPPLWELFPVSPNWIPHPATFIRKSVFQQFGNFNNKYSIAMDGEFWLRISTKKNLIVNVVSMPIVEFDEMGTSTTNFDLRNNEQIKATYMHFFNHIVLFSYNFLKLVFPFIFLQK